MTSFIIKAHLNRRIHPDWLRKDAEVKMIEDDPATCTFCRIIRGELRARKVFENEEVVAFLGEDICVLCEEVWAWGLLGYS